MKPGHHLLIPAPNRLWIVAAAGALLLSQAALRASVGLTITPSLITNDFIGALSLSVTGLTAGKTITVEIYADVNTNGIIDSADIGLRSFQLTDGQVPLVAGVRNLNVP